MRPRLLYLLAGIGILLASGVMYEISIKAQGTQNVFLGDAALFPPSLTLTGTSELRVSVATGAQVPHSGVDGTPIKAVVQVVETSNFSSINYSVDPISRIKEVPLDGGGVASVEVFKITINTDNTKTGNIAFRAVLLRLENNPSSVQPISPTTKDVTLSVVATAPTPTPTPMPTPTPTPNPCEIAQGGGGDEFAEVPAPHGNYPCHSPILIDVAGDGFSLTDLAGGVNFDLDGDGITAERVSWTAPNSDDAFLFLDRNEDGVVNNGTELFGDITPQFYAPVPNGFVALSLYDSTIHGGIPDGVINSNDDVYFKLRLWQDINHNGRSEPNELHTLPELGIESISLDYKESKRTDQYGNRFRFRAKVERTKHTDVARWAWDVFLLSQ